MDTEDTNAYDDNEVLKKYFYLKKPPPTGTFEHIKTVASQKRIISEFCTNDDDTFQKDVRK